MGESMATRTECLDPLPLKVKSSDKVGEVQSQIAAKFGWEPAKDLLRLKGFEAPWERVLEPSMSLEEAGIPAKATLTTVRTVLVAEGWGIAKGDDNDSDTDEEDF